MKVSGMGRRGVGLVASAAVAAGLAVAVAPLEASAAVGAPSAQACSPGAELDGVQVAPPSVRVRGWSTAERQVERKGAGKVRVRVKMQGTVKARAKYRATGTVQKCDGAGAKKVTLEETVSVAYPKAAAASEVRTSSRSAAKAAKSAAKDKVRARGTRSAKRAVTSAAREDAKSRLLAKAGVAPAVAAPDISALATKILALVNAERVNAGLVAVKNLPQIVPAATAWANTLVDGPFEHDPNVKAQGDALGCNQLPDGFPNTWGEAIAKGDFGLPGAATPTVDAFAKTVVDAWMASPEHKPILLNSRAAYAGIGSVYRNKVWTVVYRRASADCSNITGY